VAAPSPPQRLHYDKDRHLLFSDFEVYAYDG
jgi:hypothetical protein